MSSANVSSGGERLLGMGGISADDIGDSPAYMVVEQAYGRARVAALI
ncbi:hypothetical protein [Streptomyces massasporeus]